MLLINGNQCLNSEKVNNVCWTEDCEEIVLWQIMDVD